MSNRFTCFDQVELDCILDGLHDEADLDADEDPQFAKRVGLAEALIAELENSAPGQYEYEWQAVWMHPSSATGGNLRVEVPCIDEDQARAVVDVRLTHPRYPSTEAWVERKLKVKQPQWERVE